MPHDAPQPLQPRIAPRGAGPQLPGQLAPGQFARARRGGVEGGEASEGDEGAGRGGDGGLVHDAFGEGGEELGFEEGGLGVNVEVCERVDEVGEVGMRVDDTGLGGAVVGVVGAEVICVVGIWVEGCVEFGVTLEAAVLEILPFKFGVKVARQAVLINRF